MAQNGPVFLARAAYRQRRLRDAIRMMPVLGLALWLFPLLLAEDGMTSRVGLFIFGVWMLLIVLSGVIAAYLSRNVNEPEGGAKQDAAD